MRKGKSQLVTSKAAKLPQVFTWARRVLCRSGWVLTSSMNWIQTQLGPFLTLKISHRATMRASSSSSKFGRISTTATSSRSSTGCFCRTSSRPRWCTTTRIQAIRRLRSRPETQASYRMTALTKAAHRSCRLAITRLILCATRRAPRSQYLRQYARKVLHRATTQSRSRCC